MVPPLPINRHLGALPQVAPDYLSRRGVDWFKGDRDEAWRRTALTKVNEGSSPPV